MTGSTQEVIKWMRQQKLICLDIPSGVDVMCEFINETIVVESDLKITKVVDNNHPMAGDTITFGDGVDVIVLQKGKAPMEKRYEVDDETLIAGTFKP